MLLRVSCNRTKCFSYHVTRCNCIVKFMKKFHHVTASSCVYVALKKFFMSFNCVDERCDLCMHFLGTRLVCENWNSWRSSMMLTKMTSTTLSGSLGISSTKTTCAWCLNRWGTVNPWVRHVFSRFTLSFVKLLYVEFLLKVLCETHRA